MFNSGNLNENLSRTFGDDITKEKLNQKSSEKENFAEENLTREEEENQILDMGSMFGKLFRGRPAQVCCFKHFTNPLLIESRFHLTVSCAIRQRNKGLRCGAIL